MAQSLNGRHQGVSAAETDDREEQVHYGRMWASQEAVGCVDLINCLWLDVDGISRHFDAPNSRFQ